MEVEPSFLECHPQEGVMRLKITCVPLASGFLYGCNADFPGVTGETVEGLKHNL